MSSNLDQNKEVVRRFFEEAWGRGNMAQVDEVLLPDFRDHNAPPGNPGDREGYKVTISTFRAAFPDIQYTLEQMLAERDRVAFRLTGRGTHNGTFMGVPATGKAVAFGGMTFVRLIDGKIAERWGIADMPGLMAQLAGGPGSSH